MQISGFLEYANDDMHIATHLLPDSDYDLLAVIMTGTEHALNVVALRIVLF